MFPNTYHSDKWRTHFSNIPNLGNDKQLKYFTNYVKSIVIPEYGIPGSYDIPQPPGFYVLRTPMGGVDLNRGLGDISIEFVLSENFFNYLTLWQLIYQYRSGQLSEYRTSEVYKDYNIKCFTIYMLDNQHRDILELRFYELFIQNISSLNLVQGVCNDLAFNAVFKYNEIECVPIDPMTGGDVLTVPESIEPCGTSGMSTDINVTWDTN